MSDYLDRPRRTLPEYLRQRIAQLEAELACEEGRQVRRTRRVAEIQAELGELRAELRNAEQCEAASTAAREEAA